ncbi:MAG: uroporphyrinogen decarboxylase family protein [Oscillospiraceae bacterium]|nr:uroporphyrinogen decarboxylase family protein [Oscillospiraceae bacterium]
MTSRERVIAALAHRESDIVPFSLGFGINYPAKAELAKYMKIEMGELDRLLGSVSDIRHVGPKYIGPKTRNIGLPGGSHMDAWGVIRSPVKNERDTYMEISHYPLSHMKDAEELEGYMFPKLDWFDFSDIPGQIEAHNKHGEYAIMASGGNIFEASWYMRGFENMFSDLLEEREFARRLLEKVTDYFVGFSRKILEAANGKIDLVFTADDIGGQNGLLISPPLWEEMLKPFHKRLNETIHEGGAKVIYHSDGAVMEAVEGLVDMGIDVLEALQFDAAGMDPSKLKETAGDRLCFHGGVSVQSTLPFGTPEEVEAEVKERIKILGKNGGYILAPSHAIQAGTPPENICAFLKAAGRLF